MEIHTKTILEITNILNEKYEKKITDISNIQKYYDRYNNIYFIYFIFYITSIFFISIGLGEINIKEYHNKCEQSYIYEFMIIYDVYCTFMSIVYLSHCFYKDTLLLKNFIERELIILNRTLFKSIVNFLLYLLVTCFIVYELFFIKCNDKLIDVLIFQYMYVCFVCDIIANIHNVHGIICKITEIYFYECYEKYFMKYKRMNVVENNL